MDRPAEPVVPQVAVVAVPFPAQGHLNQLLHFSLLLSSHGVPVHYACSATHNRQAKERIHGWSAEALQSIHFHDLPLPAFSIPPPDRNPLIKFPTHLQPLFESTVHLRSPLASLLRSLSATSSRLVVVHDPLMSFAGHEASSLPNAESYRFQCIPAFTELSFVWQVECKAIEPGSKISDLLLTPFDGCFTEEFWEFALTHDYEAPAEGGVLINTSRAFDGEFLNSLEKEPGFRAKKLFAIGPVNPVILKKPNGPQHRCLEWLDKQPPASVVYMAFGSTTSISQDQAEQLAEGLRRSGQRFIWVLKDADRGDIHAAGGESGQTKLLSGYDQEVEGLGVVVRGWAPQLEILAHPSTGGFMSHCGWNSCMESLSMGVPILAWPMHSDQPRNALLVTEYLKVGIMVREWARRGEVVSSRAIEEVIKRLMLHEEGKEIRKRSKGLGEAIKKSLSEGGSSREDVDSFIAHMNR